MSSVTIGCWRWLSCWFLCSPCFTFTCSHHSKITPFGAPVLMVLFSFSSAEFWAMSSGNPNYRTNHVVPTRYPPVMPTEMNERARERNGRSRRGDRNHQSFDIVTPQNSSDDLQRLVFRYDFYHVNSLYKIAKTTLTLKQI